MPVFKITKGKLEKIRLKDFAGKEKQLQTIIENNLDTIFNMTFVKSEHPTSHGGRIDTLALDRENRPVIIEYKENKSSTILLRTREEQNYLMESKTKYSVIERAVDSHTDQKERQYPKDVSFRCCF